MADNTGIVRVKICCIESTAEAELAIRYGAAALGLVSAMPSGPGVIGEDAIADIARCLPPAVASFLLTSQIEPEAIIAQQRRCGVDTLQLVDRLPLSAYPRLREALPGIHLVQVIHVRGAESVDQAREVAPLVDAILLDSGNPLAARRELGGTGRVHDWTISRQIRDAIPRPVFLAGGLRPDNVAEAIHVVQPFAVDVCSGVRSDGHLDEARLAAFCRAVAQATAFA